MDVHTPSKLGCISGRLRTKNLSGASILAKFALGFILVFLSTSPTTGSLIPIDGFLGTAVFSNSSTTQSEVFVGPPPVPFNATHTAEMGLSTAQASYVFQLGANFIDYFVSIEHHCVQEVPNLTRCQTSGFIDFTPRNDVFVTIDGHYDYFMPTDPMSSGIGARVQRPDLPPAQQVLFGDADNASTLFNPATGTLEISASGLIPAGHHYSLIYQSQIAFIGGAPSTATGNGQIHFRVTEVPEPIALGPLALAALLIRQRRIARRG